MYNGGYQNFPPPPGGPLGFRPPPGGFPPPPGTGSPFGANPPPIGYGPPPGQAQLGLPPGAPLPPLGYGSPPMMPHQQNPNTAYPPMHHQLPPPPGPHGFSQPPPFIPPGAGMPPMPPMPPMGTMPPPGMPMGGPGPPPPFMPSGSRHVGLGAPGAAQNLPPPPNGSVRAGPGPGQAPGGPPGSATPGPSGSVSPVVGLPTRPALNGTGEVFSLFVGSIAEGVDDSWLERVLGCAGPLLTLRRIKDANGKPKAFGFAEFGDPESVLRCLEVVDGRDLPVDGGKGGNKPLKINADEKTRAKLDAYEKTRIKTDQDTTLDKEASDKIDNIIAQMRDPSVLAALSEAASKEEAANANRHTHLQDLAPEDLPEESRGLITREIQFFRERAVKREGEKKNQRNEKINAGYYSQQQMNQAAHQGSPAGPKGYQNHNNPRNGYGAGQSAPPGGPRGSQNDAQSFNRPLGFVRAGQLAAAASSASPHHRAGDGRPLTDEQEERVRAERQQQMSLAEFREKERRWLGRERTRNQAVHRDHQREKATKEQELHRRTIITTRLAAWDDSVEAAKGRELFYTDRPRWRAMRRGLREREEAMDRKDAEDEDRAVQIAKKESEAFLNQQADLFAQMGDAKWRTGANNGGIGGMLQLDEGTPIKLSFGGTKVSVPTDAATSKVKRPSAFLGNADDDDAFKQKRALIPLTYDDETHASSKEPDQKNEDGEVDEEKGMTEAQKLARRQKKVQDIVKAIPTERAALFAMEVRWQRLTPAIVAEKLRPFANKKIVEYLGLQEDELVEAVVSHVEKRKSAQALVDELEPVLAEEAEEFVIKFWRMLLFEIKAVEANITTAT